MFKTICLFAIIALAISQDVSSVVSAVDSAVGNSTIAQVAQNANSTIAAVTSAVSSVNATALPTLNSVTVGWGAREVVVTPQSANPTNDDWINNGEQLNLEQLTGAAAAGEWTLNWSVENGDDFALLNSNGELLLVDYENGVQNVVANIGVNAALNAQIASGAEQLVDDAYNSGETTISTSDVAADIDDLVNQVWANDNLQGFLAQQTSQSTVASIVSSVVSNPQAAVNSAQAQV